MDYELFSDRLLETVTGRFGILSAVAVIILVTMVAELIAWFTRKNEHGISIWSIFSKAPVFKQRLSLKQQILRDIIALSILISVMCFTGLPYFRDINNEQYVKVEGQYSRTENSSKQNLFSNGHIYIQVEQESIRLELPFDWNASEFPEGSFRATVWYSKESRVALCIQFAE